MSLSKLDIVINKNTYYFFNEDCEGTYDVRIKQLADLLELLESKVRDKNLDQIKYNLEEVIQQGDFGLEALLVLTGFSNESLKRLLSYIRITNVQDLNTKLYREKWAEYNGNIDKFKEWTDKNLIQKIKTNAHLRKGIINLLVEGSTIDSICKVLPPFEVNKLRFTKFSFNLNSLLDTMVRYRIKGSYSGDKQNNPEIRIEKILEDAEIPYVRGELPLLTAKSKKTKRRMDFIIPDSRNPKIIIESSFLVTTSSGQGDKAKAEIAMGKLIRKSYPSAMFIGFVDGIGWLVRKGDLERICSAFDNVFTFHVDELVRFKKLLDKVFK